MARRHTNVGAFLREGEWSRPDEHGSTILFGAWQGWADNEGNWKVRGPDPDNELHYASGTIELPEAQSLAAGNSLARSRLRFSAAKKAAKTLIKAMTSEA